MHDLWVASPASYPHQQSLLHPPLHPPGGARLHPPRTHSPPGDEQSPLQLAERSLFNAKLDDRHVSDQHTGVAGLVILT